MKSPIILRGCRQNNLKGFDIEIPRGKYVVITGVSGSGKSSLALDTLYAEGQRRYVESFSAYARQFLERMDRPAIDEVEGIPPAVAITQGNTVKTSRSTVGTVTEINDYVKLLFAWLGQRHCDHCGKPVLRRTPAQIAEECLSSFATEETLLVGFEVTTPVSADWEEQKKEWLRRGFIRVWNGKQVQKIEELSKAPKTEKMLMVLDRVTLSPQKRARLVDAIEQAFAYGHGKVTLIQASGKMLRFERGLRCAHCDLPYASPTPNQFSFNNPLGACPECNGFGRVIRIDPGLVVPDPSRSLAEGAIKPWTTEKTQQEVEELHRFCRQRGVSLHTPWEKLPEKTRQWIWEGEPGGWEAKKWYGIKGWFDWLETKIYKLHVRVLLSRYRIYLPCGTCGGTRFKKESLGTRLAGKNIAELYSIPMSEAKIFFEGVKIPRSLSQTQDSIEVVRKEIVSRLGYLCEVGLEYLTLDRSSRTLSGGEMQRVNLTTAVGSSLVNTLFVLDEPSIGLHPRDNDRLVALFHKLTERQNTVVVVEHDPAIVQAADHLIDLGPKSGEAGGELIYEGPVSGVLSRLDSATGNYLSGRLEFPEPRRHGAKNAKGFLQIAGAKAHNLKNLNLRFPFGTLSCVTGVSGSGKSSLVDDVIYRGILRKRGEPVEEPGACESIEGWDSFAHVSFVDQSPLSRSPKSTVASYSGTHRHIQQLFAKTPDALEKGFRPTAFSTGSAGGRCETCEGSGVERVEMQFLADVFLPCPDCGGARFKPQILQVRYQDKNIREVLGLTVEEALRFFPQGPIQRCLEVFQSVGLGYLHLGQGLNTLSGGEAQRIKLAMALQEPAPTQRDFFSLRGLYLFDEPTTGLHGADLPPLLQAFDKLLEAGNTLIVIEHNLDVIRLADFIVDLGPEGGERGGYIVAQGNPEQVERNPRSITGRFLRETQPGFQLK